MRPLILAATTALVIATAALAVGPSSVTVFVGTPTHGDAASLNAIDGDTLDIQGTSSGTRYTVAFQVNYQNPDGFHEVYIHLTAWSDHLARCVFLRKSSIRVRTTSTSATLYVGNHSGQTEVGLYLKCKSAAPFTIHFDQLTAEDSP